MPNTIATLFYWIWSPIAFNDYSAAWIYYLSAWSILFYSL